MTEQQTIHLSQNAQRHYDILHAGGRPVKTWTQGVPFEEEAKQQLLNVADLPFVKPWVAVMPDVHVGKGATIGSVIPTVNAIIPAAVGVDLGCGMMAVKTSLTAVDLPDNLFAIRSSIEAAVPHGRSVGRGKRDVGSWGQAPDDVLAKWVLLHEDFELLCERTPKLKNTNNLNHLGTLGTGNHFIELCLDENDDVWVMLHSGSRGVGNRIGTTFIERAKKEMERWMINLPDKDLAYLPEGSEHFIDYVKAVSWAQRFAKLNREVMMARTLKALADNIEKPFTTDTMAVNCHHNYIKKEVHYGQKIWITRKGAVSAQKGELGIIPGSMGAKSFIVRGLGNEESFCSCSHGAGRVMSRTAAKRLVTLEEHQKAVAGVECRLDKDVIDETPSAYKPIEDVMHAQRDLVEIVHTLKQVVCVKG
ncbi:MAG: RNA-splicing ligase RtcB [Gammaproteobacteria bacterium]|nr:MAG: RNA-splicing ligase RtcB [Gammaproteobacteria bacterium]